MDKGPSASEAVCEAGDAPDPDTFCGMYYNKDDPRCCAGGLECNLATTGGKVCCGAVCFTILGVMLLGLFVFSGKIQIL